MCVCVCTSGVCKLSDVVDLVEISNDFISHLAFFHTYKCMRESVWFCVCVCVCVLGVCWLSDVVDLVEI